MRIPNWAAWLFLAGIIATIIGFISAIFGFDTGWIIMTCGLFAIAISLRIAEKANDSSLHTDILE
jgi:hypothetical protein